jgi:hypothetical protein
VSWSPPTVFFYVKKMKLEQTTLPFAAAKSNDTFRSSNGAQPNGASPIGKPVKPVKFRFHVNGDISVRVNGRWFHQQELDQRLYLSWPGEVRRRVMKRIVQAEYLDGQSRITGSAVVVTRNNGG